VTAGARTGADLTLLTDETVSIQLALTAGIEESWDDCVAPISPWFFDDEGHGLRENHIADVHAWLVDRSS